MKKMMGIIITASVLFNCNEGSEIGNPLDLPDSIWQDTTLKRDTSEIRCWSEEQGIYELPK